MGIGPWEIVILLVVLVIIFGAGRLSQVGGAVGKSVREFRSAVQDQPASPPAPALPPITCPACQATNNGSNRFCSTCGATLTTPAASLPAAEASPAVTEAPVAVEGGQPAPPKSPPAAVPTNICPSCATVNPPGQPFCGQCGTRLAPAAA